MANIPNRNNWFFGDKDLTMLSRDKLVRLFLNQYFIRSNEMFEYEGLPDTIPKQDYLLIKQRFGSVTLAYADNGNAYAFNGALGGELQEYYHPTKSIVVNPWLKFEKTFEIDKDCVVIKNDIFYQGLYEYNLMYAEMKADALISLRFGLINARLDNVFESDDDNTDASVKKFIDDVIDGKLSHIHSKKFQDTALFNIHRTATGTDKIKSLIEAHNYIDACWFLDFGLNSNYNMKRETLTDAETSVDNKTLIPFIKQMYDCEIDGWKKANKMFGWNVKVKLSDVWKKMYDEVINNKPIEEKENEKNEGDNNVIQENE